MGVEPGEKPASFARAVHHLEVMDEAGLAARMLPEFDVITMWHVLEHVHGLDERMEKIRKVLSPDGTLVIAVPNSESWDATHYGKFWAAYDLPRHLYHFSQKTIGLLAEKYGMKIIDIVPMKLDAFYICLLSEKYRKGKHNIFSAFIKGLRSNAFARKNRENYSSLIFVLSMKKTENKRI